MSLSASTTSDATETAQKGEMIKSEEDVYNFDPEVPAAEKEDGYSLLLEFVKQLRPGMELYRISVPTFILQPISLLEKLSIYSSPSDLIDGIDKLTTPELRFTTILKWVLSNWRTIPRSGIEGVKPYNPVLGEQFECSWEHASDNSKSIFVAEQVSHHPPVSAFFMYNEKRSFYYYGYCAPSTHFHWNSFSTTMDGEFIVELPKFGERYEIKQPPVYVNGIIWGKKIIEIGDKLVLSCKENKFNASIAFDSGSTLEGKIMNNGTVASTIKGVVNKQVHIVNSGSGRKQSILYDVDTIKRNPKKIKPVYEQKENESRRNWHKVTVALRKEDHEEASLQKYKIEERERKLRKTREEGGGMWKPKLFQQQGKHWVYINAPKELKLFK